MFKIKNIVLAFILLFLTKGLVEAQSALLGKENIYYQIKSVPIPEDIILEVGGLAFTADGTLGVSTRRGEIWTVQNPGSENPLYTRFAHGLHEPLGLAYRDGAFWCVQRPELTKLTDLNGDGIADSYEPIYSWPLDGNYHEYGYGPLFLPNGDMIVALNLGWVGRGISNSKWRGWMLKISQDGKMTPLATGMRSPAGMGLDSKGELFYAENQGDWVGSGRITHVSTGDFVGNPEGLKWSQEKESPVKLKFDDITDTLGYTLFEYAQKKEGIKVPTVWFPHTLMGISTSDILLIDHDQFGPFQGQLLVGDQGHSKIMRVALEQVEGVYQGAVFGFKEGFSSGVLRMIWGPDKSMYVGMTNRGWASTGREPYGLQRLVWTGKSPFEIKDIKAQSDGFILNFTQAVDRASAANPDNYSINDFTYLYHHFYGSPVQDIQSRAIYKVEVAQDGLSARLYCEGLREGYIYEIKAPGIKSQKQEKLLHDFGYYTLNKIPGGAKNSTSKQSKDSTADAPVVKSNKRIDKMPADWTDGPDTELQIGSQPGMLYDKSILRVKAGSKVKLSFNNPDDMIHNLVITLPGKADEVGKAALNLGLKGQEMEYVPINDDVLYHTTLLEPNSNDVIYFVAPEEPGSYEYVCTFPGHYMTMRGILKVE